MARKVGKGGRAWCGREVTGSKLGSASRSNGRIRLERFDRAKQSHSRPLLFACFCAHAFFASSIQCSRFFTSAAAELDSYLACSVRR